MQKIVYDKINGEKVVLDDSDLCPVSGRWLIPSKCTEKEPPKKEDGFRLAFIEGEWRQIDEEEESNAFQKGPSSGAKSIREEIEELKGKVDFLEKEMTERRSEIAFLRSEFLKSEIRSLVVEEIGKR